MDKLDHYIGVWDLLPVPLCKQVMLAYENSCRWMMAALENGNRDISVRRCDSLSLLETYDKQEEGLNQMLQGYMGAAITLYSNQHPYCGVQGLNGLELLRYQGEGFYTSHIDQTSCHNRALSVVIFLNETFSGGELQFWDGSMQIDAKAGRIVVFPSNFLYPHRVCPVETGIRYSCVGWWA